MTYNKNLTLYPLTHPQKRVWYAEKIYDNAPFYNIGGCMRIKGDIDIVLLEDTLNLLIKNNVAFRLRIVMIDDEVKQFVNQYKRESIEFLDFSVYKEPNNELQNWLDNQNEISLLKEQSNLYYFAIYKMKEGEYGIFLKMHHIISDGWSFAIIVRQICDIYRKLANKELDNSGSEPSYIDFIESERLYINSDRFIKDKKFWLDKFNDFLPTQLFNNSRTSRAARLTLDIDEDKSFKIRKFLNDYKISLNSFFIAIVFMYLSKINHVDNLAIGVPIFNRTGKKERSTIGMFTSTMPFTYNVDKEQSSVQVIKNINKELMNCLFHQKYPYNILIQDLEISKKGYDSLFQICVNYYNTNFQSTLNGTPIEIIDLFSNNQNYALQIVIKDWSDVGHISLAFDYKVDEISKEYIENMNLHFNRIIDQILQNPILEVGNLELITESELRELLYDFNSTYTDYPRGKTVIKLFEEQVEKTPENVALNFDGEMITYQCLNRKANQLARKLRAFGIGKGKIVGLIVHHSIETVSAIIGVLKAGAAYVPIDPNYPQDRISYILEDSGITFVLTNCVSNYDLMNGDVINLNDTSLYEGEASNLVEGSLSSDLAYIIYTSGSSGKPKGVMIEHKGLLNYVYWARKMYIKNQNEVFALYSSLTFDLTVTSIFTPLINGNSVYIYNNNGDEFVLYKILRDNIVNILKLTPAHLSLLKDMDNSVSSIKRLIVGGENLKCSLAASVFQSFGKCIEIFNEYGPTETVVGCMIYKYNHEIDLAGSVPIGLPADNVQMYILDEDLKFMPIDTIGELYISGDGVARGYLNREELTTKYFIENPFVKGMRMYKTGDLVKLRRDGLIEFIGRVDRQTKIRGHRIELGEIEEQLLGIDEISDAIVIVKENSKAEKSLCAYIVAPENISILKVKKMLQNNLPNYMVPVNIVVINEIPLTANGKLNIMLLPEPKNIIESGTDYVSFRSEVEEKLVMTIKEVLNLEKVSMKDDFYELGGDSIKAIQISNRLNNIGLIIRVRDILSHSIIEEIASCIEHCDKITIVEQKTNKGYSKHTPIIKWFFEQNFRNKNYWNQSILLKVNNHINIKMLTDALKRLITHHDSLRLNYDVKRDCLYYNNEYINRDILIESFDISKYDKNEQDMLIQEFGEKIKGSFDIESDLLIKGAIFDLGSQGRRFLLTAHHLVVDGISWRIILEDLNSLLQKPEVELPLKTHSWQTWTHALEEYSKGLGDEDVEYWSKVIEKQELFPKDPKYDISE